MNLEKIRKDIKKSTLDNISFSYDAFRKDIKNFPSSVINLSEDQEGILTTLDKNKNNVPIFFIDDCDVEYNIKVPVIPYKKFYIATNIAEIIGDDIYRVNGLFFTEFNNMLICWYFWSRTIADGWKPGHCFISRDGLSRNLSIENIKNKACMLSEEENYTYKHRDIEIMVLTKAVLLLRKMIYKISKNDYTKYMFYTHGRYTQKTISNSHSVLSHKRHFWKDSGRFKIPNLPKDEIIKLGYGIDDMVFRDGELRLDVPYRIISSFEVSTDKEKKQDNQEYFLIKKRVWKCEEKVFKILIDIFPDKIIKRHDRRTLNGLELDFNLPELRLGIEYDGEQHFDRKICEEVFRSNFDEQVRRDRQKDKLCRRKNIKLIRIKYDEPLTKSYIKKKLKAGGFL